MHGPISGQRTLVVTLLAVLVLAACTRETGEDTKEGTNPSPGEIVVEVLLTDDGIEMPAQIGAGGVLFEVTNGGTVPHGFAVDDVEERLDSLQPDQLETLRLDLAAGTYTVYSPVEGDREGGLEIELTVSGEARASAAPLNDEGVGGSEEQVPIGSDAP